MVALQGADPCGIRDLRNDHMGMEYFKVRKGLSQRMVNQADAQFFVLPQSGGQAAKIDGVAAKNDF